MPILPPDPLLITPYKLAERYVGVKEVSGKIDNPLILAMLQLDVSWPGSDQVPWCLTGETEVLTNVGWIRFDALRSTAQRHDLHVMQVDPHTRTASLAPFIGVEKHYSGDIHVIERRGLSFGCDPQHRFYGDWASKGLRVPSVVTPRPITALRSKVCMPLVETFDPVRPSPMTDTDIDFLAAYLADGNLKSPNRVQFNVSRLDKVTRLLALHPNHVYQRTRLYGKNKTLATNLVFHVGPDFLARLTDDVKSVRWDVALSWTASQRARFVETFREFDGSERENAGTISTTRKAIVDLIQALACLSGYRVSFATEPNSFDGRPTANLHSIHYSNGHRSLTIAAEHRRIEPFSGTLYCVSVPTGAFVARGGHMPFVSGNCSAFVNWIQWHLRLPRSKSLRARSFLEVGTPIDIHDAVVGFDVVILNRGGSPDPDVLESPGHVGYFAAYDPSSARVTLLAGNQGNSVNLTRFAVSDLLGVRRLA